MSFYEFYEIFNQTCFAEHLRKIYDMEANPLWQSKIRRKIFLLRRQILANTGAKCFLVITDR